MRYIGDVHGKIAQYLKLTNCAASIQVGDMGAGFVPLPLFPELPLDHRFIRGNHDDPDVCRANPNWIADRSFDGERYFIGGAWSIDHAFRTIGVDWWAVEELSWSELDAAIDDVVNYKPKIIVSHDGPGSVMQTLFPYRDRNCRTQTALDAMFTLHQPEIWLFGHWHTNIDTVINGTRFICLAELSYIDLD